MFPCHSVKCYGGRLDYVDHVLGFCVTVLEKLVGGKVDSDSVKYVMELLTEPLNILALDTLKLKVRLSTVHRCKLERVASSTGWAVPVSFFFLSSSPVSRFYTLLSSEQTRCRFKL